jgi:hypothetical protein
MTSNKDNKRMFWERQKGESRQAFEAFAVYRDMGVTRSTAKVARELGKSKALMDRWSARWLWVARADAYDAEIDRQRRLSREEQIVQHLDRAASLGRFLQSVGLAGLRELQGRNVVEPPTELVRYIVAGIAEERRALGLPSDAVVYELRGGAADPAVQALNRATELLR